MKALQQLLLTTPHGRTLALETVVGMIIPENVERTVNHESGELLAHSHTVPSRVEPGDRRCDVDVTDNR